jgi:flagellar biosynthesis/type III secretory pathway protein FliH
VYNINSGHNAEILEKSRTLGGYSTFVYKVREYAQTFTLEEAMKKAVKYCVDNNILKTFLETHSSEVFNMLLTEWDTEEAKVVWREEGFEEGLEEGMEKGREETHQFFLELLNQGLTAEEMKQRLSQNSG